MEGKVKERNANKADALDSGSKKKRKITLPFSPIELLFEKKKKIDLFLEGADRKLRPASETLSR